MFLLGYTKNEVVGDKYDDSEVKDAQIFQKTNTYLETPQVDELWNVADFAVEVPRLIDRFSIPHQIDWSQVVPHLLQFFKLRILKARAGRGPRE